MGATITASPEGCGALVTCRAEDCDMPQNPHLDPNLAVWDACAEDPHDAPDPFTRLADWNQAARDTRQGRRAPEPARPRTELAAARRRVRRLKPDLYRDDPPA